MSQGGFNDGTVRYLFTNAHQKHQLDYMIKLKQKTDNSILTCSLYNSEDKHTYTSHARTNEHTHAYIHKPLYCPMDKSAHGTRYKDVTTTMKILLSSKLWAASWSQKQYPATVLTLVLYAYLVLTTAQWATRTLLFIDELRTRSRTHHHGRGKIQIMQWSPVDCITYHHTPVHNPARKETAADHEELRPHLPF